MTNKGFSRGWLGLSMAGVLAVTAAACGSDGGAQADGAAGTTGSAGRAGTSGGGGTGGGRACPTAQYTATTAFGAIFDGWAVAANSSPGLAPMADPDGGPATGTKLELDTADGSPAAGSAKLSIPFSMPGEEMLFAKLYTPGVNLAGTTVSAKVKLDSGLITGPTDTGTAFIALTSGAAYTWAPGTSITLDPTAGWQTLTLLANAPSPGLPTEYEPCDIREIDVIVRTGDTGMYRAAVVHIDTIAITAN
jgi:hypothetical protein